MQDARNEVDNIRIALTRGNFRTNSITTRYDTAWSENDDLKRNIDQLTTSLGSIASENRQLHDELEAERSKSIELSEQIRVSQDSGMGRYAVTSIFCSTPFRAVLAENGTDTASFLAVPSCVPFARERSLSRSGQLGTELGTSVYTQSLAQYYGEHNVKESGLVGYAPTTDRRSVLTRPCRPPFRQEQHRKRNGDRENSHFRPVVNCDGTERRRFQIRAVFRSVLATNVCIAHL